jgi:heme/copper-type cytochrome/quinol oxidase subunit 2
MDNSNKLIEKIRESQVKPIPRWHYRLKDIATWLVFLFCILFGALAFSVILFAIQQVDFNMVSHVSHSHVELILVLVPVFWIISLVIFLVIAIFSLKYSKKGYKYTVLSLMSFSTALSILLGTVFFISGGGVWLEHAFAARVSNYESIQERKMRVWSGPDTGSLSGTILSASDVTIELQDFQGKTWQVDYQDADIVPAVGIIDGEKIKMTGKMTSENTFKADKLRPWGGSRHRYNGGRNIN